MEVKPLSVSEAEFLPSTPVYYWFATLTLGSSPGLCCSQHPANTVKVIFALSSVCLQVSAGISCPGLSAELERLADRKVSQVSWQLSKSQKGTAPNPASSSFFFFFFQVQMVKTHRHGSTELGSFTPDTAGLVLGPS